MVNVPNRLNSLPASATVVPLTPGRDFATVFTFDSDVGVCLTPSTTVYDAVRVVVVVV